MIHCHGIQFYLSFNYCKIRQSFVIYIVLPDSPNVASNYTAKIFVEENGPANPLRLTYYKKVISIFDWVDIDDGDAFLPGASHLILPRQQMRRFFTIRNNEFSFVYPEENDKCTVELPVKVESIIITNH